MAINHRDLQTEKTKNLFMGYPIPEVDLAITIFVVLGDF